jgi:hypothetical protein
VRFVVAVEVPTHGEVAESGERVDCRAVDVGVVAREREVETREVRGPVVGYACRGELDGIADQVPRASGAEI